MFFFHVLEGIENCKMPGKSQGILRWMISGNPDKIPCGSLQDEPLQTKMSEDFMPVILHLCKTSTVMVSV